MSEFYGIDLGTTYSCIATIDQDDLVTVISNPKGDLTTPSVVALDDKGKWIVGKAAKSKLGSDPDNVVAFIKREMSNATFKCKLQGKEFTPVDISAQILKYLVDFANKHRVDEEGKQPIYDVVITVPAYFGKLERDRTLEAGKQAGLNVLQLVNEPTAAALSYGRSQKDDKVLLVYDLGGGTFDVSIMKFENHIADVLSTRGDHHLGGADWDRAIVDYALGEIGAKWDDLDKATQGMLMNAAEETKKTISGDDDEAILTFNFKGIQNVTIRRSDFEARTRSLMQRSKGYVEDALQAANMKPIDIDEVILVGGSSRMPMVKAMVDEMFPDSDVKIVDPDRAVAKGAALTAMQKAKENAGDTSGVAGALYFRSDKGSRAYGISALNSEGKLVVFNLIMLNDDLNIERHFDSFETSANGQTLVEMHFYESESEYDVMDVDPALEIPAVGGDQEVNWGTPKPKGTPIDISVKRNDSGEVRVFVSCGGASKEFIMDTARKGMVKMK